MEPSGPSHAKISCVTRGRVFIVLASAGLSLAGCSTLKTISIDPGITVQHTATTAHSTPSRIDDASIRAQLPRNADTRRSVLGYQATLLRQGLYLDTRGHIRPLTPVQKKKVTLRMDPAQQLPDGQAAPIRVAPVLLTVPGQSTNP